MSKIILHGCYFLTRLCVCSHVVYKHLESAAACEEKGPTVHCFLQLSFTDAPWGRTIQSNPSFNGWSPWNFPHMPLSVKRWKIYDIPRSLIHLWIKMEIVYIPKARWGIRMLHLVQIKLQTSLTMSLKWGMSSNYCMSTTSQRFLSPAQWPRLVRRVHDGCEWSTRWNAVLQLSVFPVSRGHLTAGWGGGCALNFPGDSLFSHTATCSVSKEERYLLPRDVFCPSCNYFSSVFLHFPLSPAIFVWDMIIDSTGISERNNGMGCSTG